MNRKFIFTGAPGSGKTSVACALERLGYEVLHEAATDVILEGQKAGRATPWHDRDFIDKVLALQKQRRSSVQAGSKPQFHDRSPFCTVALARFLKIKPPEELTLECDHCLNHTIYQREVFFFDLLFPLENTAVRTLSYEEARIFERIHREVYESFSFTCIFVSKASITERCSFILEHALQTKP